MLVPFGQIFQRLCKAQVGQTLLWRKTWTSWCCRCWEHLGLTTVRGSKCLSNRHTLDTVLEDLNTYTPKPNQPTNQFSDAQEPIGLFMLMCDNIKYYLKQCSSPSHGQHCAMSGHTTKRRTKTLILRRGNRVVAGSKIMLPEDLVCSDLSFLCTNLSDHWEVGKKNNNPLGQMSDIVPSPRG